jgi:3',5'-cyclic AMP phosphodiesterase CpdA
MTRKSGYVAMSAVLLSAWVLAGVTSVARQNDVPVVAIQPPATPLPSEADSASVTKFSFIAYGDTRGRRDGSDVQYEHSLVVDSMLASIKKLAPTASPVKFILQSGDAVNNGAIAPQWNVSFTPLINRLTAQGGVSYFLVPGNHDVSGAEAVTIPGRQTGLRNYLAAMANLIPAEGSPRRLPGYPTYAFAYGNTFVLGLDADIAGDETQFAWVTSQLEGLDRKRFTNLIVFCHHAPFSSGPHGGPNVENPTAILRARYMPLFQAQHVRAVFSGHEHLFEHWVERYTDASGPHRMDLIVSGGGGAPIYTYSGEPDLKPFLQANAASKLTLEHLVKPSADAGENPYHYVIVHVDGDRLDLEVVGVDWGARFQPYRTNKTTLQDPN